MEEKGVSFNGDEPENNMLLAAMSLDPTISATRPYTTIPDTLSLVPEDHEYLQSQMIPSLGMNTPRGNTPNPMAATISKQN